MKDDALLAPFPGVVAAISKLAADNRSGAAEVLSRAAEVFELLVESAAGGGSRSVAEVGDALVEAQPDMAPIANLVAHVREAADLAANPVDALVLASRAAREFVEWAAEAAERAAGHAAALIAEGSNVLTHSRSSTVTNAFKIARRGGRTFRLVVTESRPMMEGRSVAAEAARLGIPVTLIADAVAPAIMSEIDLVIVGADKLTSHSFVNKIGTRMVALAARELGRPMYAVSDTSKFDRADQTRPRSLAGERAPDELWPDAPEGVKILNRYFEETPLNLLTGIVTEDGTRRSAN